MQACLLWTGTSTFRETTKGNPISHSAETAASGSIRESSKIISQQRKRKLMTMHGWERLFIAHLFGRTLKAYSLSEQEANAIISKQEIQIGPLISLESRWKALSWLAVDDILSLCPMGRWTWIRVNGKHPASFSLLFEGSSQSKNSKFCIYRCCACFSDTATGQRSAAYSHV